jgi:hypothetical protein
MSSPTTFKQVAMRKQGGGGGAHSNTSMSNNAAQAGAPGMNTS